MTPHEIANRDTERRNFSVRVLLGIYRTSYGAIGTMYPSGGEHIIFFSFMHCNNRIFGSLIQIKDILLQPHTYICKMIAYIQFLTVCLPILGHTQRDVCAESGRPP